LTPKQARFVAEYVKDLNATQAAIRAGYSKRTAKAIGCENLTKPDIAAAVAEKQGAIGERLELTAEKVLRDLEQARVNAMATLEWGPAIRASELLGKHLGMFGDRVTVTDERNVIRVPDSAENPEAWQGTHKPH
jgi:phage terminase small subunit